MQFLYRLLGVTMAALVLVFLALVIWIVNFHNTPIIFKVIADLFLLVIILMFGIRILEERKEK